ncbi:MAG TPA: hypothetical protein VGC99_11370 [Candidatus Tectomicrobia bacterium]
MIRKKWLVISMMLVALVLSACTQVIVPEPVSTPEAALPESTTEDAAGNMTEEQMAPTQTPEADEDMGQAGSMTGMAGMEGMASDFTTDELAPLVLALYAGEEIFFLHTEVSDLQVADVLTEMMGPQVVVVPKLAEISADLLGVIYVFTNGVEGMGPMGFQPDIFTAVPGDEVYTPLVEIHLVAWQDEVTPRVLRTMAELQAAEDAGEVTIQPSGIVVNAPVLVWPGGHR